ncbi:hypothetical protein B0H13DRAFT_1862032 [Mycena leptocephala]|nr:hypothetical protein B0H13DRAFT_1862032 [Mycena leptocephala]
MRDGMYANKGIPAPNALVTLKSPVPRLLAAVDTPLPTTSVAVGKPVVVEIIEPRSAEVEDVGWKCVRHNRHQGWSQPVRVGDQMKRTLGGGTTIRGAHFHRGCSQPGRAFPARMWDTRLQHFASVSLSMPLMNTHPPKGREHSEQQRMLVWSSENSWEIESLLDVEITGKLALCTEKCALLTTGTTALMSPDAAQKITEEAEDEKHSKTQSLQSPPYQMRRQPIASEMSQGAVLGKVGTFPGVDAPASLPFQKIRLKTGSSSVF